MRKGKAREQDNSEHSRPNILQGNRLVQTTRYGFHDCECCACNGGRTEASSKDKRSDRHTSKHIGAINTHTAVINRIITSRHIRMGIGTHAAYSVTTTSRQTLV